MFINIYWLMCIKGKEKLILLLYEFNMIIDHEFKLRTNILYYFKFFPRFKSCNKSTTFVRNVVIETTCWV